MASPSIENGWMEGDTDLFPPEERDLSICSDVDPTERYHRENYCDGRMSSPLMIAMLVLGFVTVIINLGVIIRTVKILRNTHESKPAFYFIGNLAMSDLVIGLYVVIAFLLHLTSKTDLWQKSTCMLQIGVAVTACQETIFTITLIAVDKYLYICHGLRYTFIVTNKRVYIAITLTWVLSILIGALPAMGLHVSWEEACNRCVFPQVVSPDFTIIFFVTSVAVPYLVVVSLYSILLVLAIKMQKIRYGGSYKSASSAPRFSNLRLSFMSTTKSSRSNSKSSLSSSSSSALKATRRKTRKKEMEEYKATLPGLMEQREAAKLIRYKSEDEGDPKPEERRVNGREGMEKLIEGAMADQKSKEEVVASWGVKHTSSLPLSSDSSVGDTSNEKRMSDVNGTMEEYECTHSRSGDVEAVACSTGGHGKAGTGEKGDAGDIGGDTDEGRTDTEEGRHMGAGRSVEGTSQDSSTAPTNGKETMNASLDPPEIRIEQPNSTKPDYPRLNENDPPTRLPDDDPPATSTSNDDKHLSSTTDEEGATGEDTDPTRPPTTTHKGHSWFPSEYLNRVVTDTKDKVLFLKKCRAVKTVFLIIGSFTATYVPFVVGSLVYANEEEKRVCLLHMLNTLLYCVVVANSIANPLIYAYGYSEFRLKTKKFQGILAREKKRKV